MFCWLRKVSGEICGGDSSKQSNAGTKGNILEQKESESDGRWKML